MKINEIVDDIFELKNDDGKSKSEIIDVIELVTPGSELRQGLEEIIAGQTGALIVIGSNETLKSIMKGGFKVDTKYSPSRLFELSKMDGAIIISDNLKEIEFANIHLVPNGNITSDETGIRHRSAEQTAKQTKLPVIAVSKRRGMITVFFKEEKYVLQDLPLLLTKATHAIRDVSDARIQIDSAIDDLTYSEINSSATIEDVAKALQRTLSMFNKLKVLENLIIELGEQGKDIRQSQYEYIFGLENEFKNIILDYTSERAEINDVISNLVNMDSKDYADLKKISFQLGFNKDTPLDSIIEPRGYRILSKIPKLDKGTIDKIISVKKGLNSVLISSEEEIASECMISTAKARIIRQRLNDINDFMDAKMCKI